MRGFNCMWYGDLGNAKITCICWNVINTYYTQTAVVNPGTVSLPVKKEGTPEFIYISDFDDPITRDYQQLLVDIINQITPCELVDIPNKGRLIKFRLLESYDQSLILLSFIRNLWYEPVLSVMQGKQNIYVTTFFQALANSEREDPLEKLTEANIAGCQAINCNIAIGHCNAGPWRYLKIKNTAQLFNFLQFNTQTFLTKD